MYETKDEEKKVTRKLNIINIKIKVTFLLTVCIADRMFDIGMPEMWENHDFFSVFHCCRVQSVFFFSVV